MWLYFKIPCLPNLHPDIPSWCVHAFQTCTLTYHHGVTMHSQHYKLTHGHLLCSRPCCPCRGRLLEGKVTGMEASCIRLPPLDRPLSLPQRAQAIGYGQSPRPPLLRQPAVAVAAADASPKSMGRRSAVAVAAGSHRRLRRLLGLPLPGRCCRVPAGGPVDPVLTAHAASQHVESLTKRDRLRHWACAAL